MTDAIYRQLAAHLDATPNGYPATESGIELRVLEHLFSPKHAALALHLTLDGATVPEIAEMSGLDEATTRERLVAMKDKGLISGGAWRGVEQFALMPFAVGFYEAQLPHLDAEMAALFEAYFLETGGVPQREPALHRVIPVGEAVDNDLEIQAYEQAEALIHKARAWGVRDCICRTQQKLIGKGCDAPIENCLVFAPVPGAFDDSDVDRAITKEEAIAILRQAEEAGLVHSTGNYRRGIHYI